jgi:hypothetical protein
MRSSGLSIEPNVRSGRDSETLVAARGILFGIAGGVVCWALILVVSLLQT